jgi:hypothetical protein
MAERSITQGMRPNRHSIDDDSATRLLQGAVHPDDAPPGYASVADLLATAASLPAVDEGAGAPTISAMVEAIRASAPVLETPRRKSMLGKLLAGKALVAVGLVLTAGGAAAATGTLPDQAQAAVSDAASHVGVNIPHPNHGKSKDHRQDGVHKPSGDDEAPAGDDNSADDKGMSGVVDRLKTNRADDAGPLGQDVCKVASENKCHSGTENKGKGGGDNETTTPETDGPHENQGRSDEHGKPEVTPTTPTTGSIATGEDHSSRDLPSSDKGKAGSDH